MIRTTLIALLVLVSAAAAACEKNNAAPSPVAGQSASVSIAGNWTGTMQTANFGTPTLTMVLTQTGANVIGTWTSNNGWEGTIFGAIDLATFVGEATLLPTASRTGCSGRGTVRGTVTAQMLNLTSTAFAGVCNELPTDVRLVLQRR